MADPQSVSNLSTATRTLLEHLPVGTYEVLIHPDGRPEFTYVSSRWLELCGLDRVQFMADQGLALAVIHPDDRQRMIDDNRRAAAEGVAFRWEGRLLVHGKVVWVAIISNPHADGDGRTRWEGVMIDISAYKQLETQLRAAEGRLRRLFEHLPLPVSVASLDADRRVLFSNAAFERAFGYGPEDIPTVADWARLAYPDPAYRAEVFGRWDAAVATAAEASGDVPPMAFRVTCRDGRVRETEISTSIVDGLLVTAFVDITERGRAAAELAAKEAELRRLVDGLPIGVAIISLDANPRIEFLNARFTQTVGYTLDDIPTAGDWARLAYPDAAYRREIFAVWDAAVERAITDTGRVESMEARVTAKDGRVLDALLNAIVLDQRLLVTLVDMTALKQAERALRSAREALERTAFEVTENIPVGTYTMVLPAGADMAHFSFMSDRFLELTGLDRETAAADPMQAFACIHPDDYDQWVALNAEAFAKRRPFFGESRVIVNGEVRWITAESTPRELPDGSIVWEGVLIDITERKRFEEELTHARAAAEAANQAKSAFLANMSHEIRTPMTGIIGLAQLVLRGELNPGQRHELDKLERLARSLLGILNDILDLSKIEAGRVAVEQIPFDLRQMIDEVRQFLEHNARDKGLDLVVELDPALTSHYLGDPLRLRQVLTNLLGNAIKFTDTGEVRLRVSVAVSSGAGSSSHGERLRFEVCDTGIGISAEQQQTLFKPFFQADDSTTRRYGGSGLGLAISQQLVELMGGQIEVQSAPGQGSCFRFDIATEAVPAPAPQSAPESTAERAPRQVSQPAASSAAGPGLAGRCILLVEDNAINQQIICGLLADTGLRIEVAENGRQAVALYRASMESTAEGGSAGPKLPELILMDLQMPVMDGYEATRQIRALDAQVPIVALTANAFPQDVAKTLAAGMNAHLSKPIDLKQLSAVIADFLQPGDTPAIPGGAEADSRPEAARTTEPDADFPHIPGIDRALCWRMTDGDPSLLQRLLQALADDFGDAPQQTARDLADGETATASRRLHTLRGIAGQLGAADLAKAAGALERAIEANAGDISEPFAALTAILQALLAASAPWRQAAASPPDRPTARPVGHLARQQAEKAVGKPARLLIVDDNPMAVETLSRALKGMGELISAGNGAEALLRTAQTPVDLILLDARMPGMDGFDTCRILHRDYPDIPVIFVTADDDIDSEVRALQAGALDFISKPIHAPVVRARVGVYLQLKAQGDRLRLSEARYARAARGTSDGLWEWQVQTGESYLSPRYKALLGYADDEVENTLEGFETLVHPDDLPKVRAAHAAHLQQREPFDIELRMRNRAGEYRWFRSRAQAEWDADGTPLRMAGAISDITQQKRDREALQQAKEAAEQANRDLQAANRELNRLATTDRLTGIFNRLSFETRAGEEINRSERYGQPLSLLLFDIDHFKSINDRFGHLVGDEVLIEVVQRARVHLRATDVLARWGGEEFTIMLPQSRLAEAVALAEKLRALLADTPLPEVGQVTASFGVAEWSPGDDLDHWVKRADEALYAAKAGGRNRVESQAGAG